MNKAKETAAGIGRLAGAAFDSRSFFWLTSGVDNRDDPFGHRNGVGFQRRIVEFSNESERTGVRHW